MSVIDPRLSVAPMLDYTDRHARYLLRLLTRHTTLYTEMVVDQALLRGDAQRFLAHDQSEHPVVLQLGGSNPRSLAQAARLGVDAGYDQINLNLGCPSPRVKAGSFGAALMAQPDRVADIFAAMQQAVKVEVTLKCRIGIDDRDSWEDFSGFVETVARAGCRTFIVHARKAWLNGLNPRQNRSLPPLKYEFVHRLKQENPQLTVIINGGFNSLSAAAEQLKKVDGTMIGRAAYHDLWMMSAADQLIYKDGRAPVSRHQVLSSYIDYMATQLAEKVPLRLMSRHLSGFYLGSPGAKSWRRCIAEDVGRNGDLQALSQAVVQMERLAA